jgi:trehalose-6-phosphatase
MSISAISSSTLPGVCAVLPGSGQGNVAALEKQQRDLQQKIADEKACQSDDQATKDKKIAEYQQKLQAIEAQIAKTTSQKQTKDEANQPPVSAVALVQSNLFNILV